MESAKHLPRVKIVTNAGLFDTNNACSLAFVTEFSLLKIPLTGPTTDS